METRNGDRHGDRLKPSSACEETFHILYFFDQTLWLLFFSLLVFVRLLFEGGIYFFEKTRRHQRRLDKVRTSGTVMLSVVRTASQSCCQPWKGIVQHEQP